MTRRVCTPSRIRTARLAAALALTTSLLQAQGENTQAGAELFATRGCAHCHGNTGAGTDSGPALQGLRKRLKPEQIEHQIVAGGQAMPAFGDTLNHEQVQDLVKFLRAKSWPAAAPAAGK